MSTHSKLIRLFTILTALVMLFSLAACNSAPSGSEAQQNTTAAETKATDATQTETVANTTEAAKTNTNGAKTLVVYFSATGTTKGVAEQIAEAVNADTYEILAAQPYTADDLNWNDSNSRTTKEQNDKAVRPEIGSDAVSLDGYSTVFIGYPIWWGEEPRIMDTFVESYDFSGKTMIPFCTSASSPLGTSASNLHALAPDAVWKDGRRFAAGTSRETIEAWLQETI